MQNPEGPTDQQLCIQFLSGSKKAFETIFEKYRDRVFLRIYLGMKGNKAYNEEEIRSRSQHYTEKVFLWLWNNKTSVKDVTDLSKFLMKAALTEVLKNK
jgi:hypothetical protein